MRVRIVKISSGESAAPIKIDSYDAELTGKPKIGYVSLETDCSHEKVDGIVCIETWHGRQCLEEKKPRVYIELDQTIGGVTFMGVVDATREELEELLAMDAKHRK